MPSFVREAKSENKGVVFGHKLKTAEEIAVACGCVGRLNSRVGVHAPNSRADLPVHVCHLCSFPVPPAPGGNVEVLSFAELAIRQGKGVQFGHRLKSQADIDEALGRPSMPGPSAYLLHDLWERNREGLEGPTFGCVAGSRVTRMTAHIVLPGVAAKAGQRLTRVVGSRRERCWAARRVWFGLTLPPARTWLAIGRTQATCPRGASSTRVYGGRRYRSAAQEL